MTPVAYCRTQVSSFDVSFFSSLLNLLKALFGLSFLEDHVGDGEGADHDGANGAGEGHAHAGAVAHVLVVGDLLGVVGDGAVNGLGALLEVEELAGVTEARGFVDAAHD